MSFLFVDRILQMTPELVRGVKHVTRDDYYLSRDEHGNLCFISSFIGETLGQLAAWSVMSSNNFTLRPVAGLVGSAYMHRPVYVGETILLESFIDHHDDVAIRYHSVATVGDEVVFTLKNAMGPMLPMDNFIATDVIQRQFAEINRPGEWAMLPAGPSTSDARVSLPNMTFDRVLSATPAVELFAEKRITRAAPYFPDHFPNNPVLPMSVLLECKMNLARDFVAAAAYQQKYKIQELRKVKMNEFIHPGDVVVCHLTVKRQEQNELVLSLRSEVDGKRVCVLDVILVASGEA